MASSGVFGNDYTADTLIVISTAVEKSQPSMVRGALWREISRLRVSIALKHIPFTSPRHPARDDGGAQQQWRHPVSSEMTIRRTPLSSFRPQRSGVEKSQSSNGTSATRPIVISTAVEKSQPSMLRAALWREISRLRVSIALKHIPFTSPRHPARDDGGAQQQWRHPVSSEMTIRRTPLSSFRPQWRNLSPLWYGQHCGGRSLDSEFQ